MTRNSAALASFVAYCEANPEQRFWQALRNWSGHDYVATIDVPYEDDMWGFVLRHGTPVKNTFFLEGDGKRGEEMSDEADRRQANQERLEVYRKAAAKTNP